MLNFGGVNIPVPWILSDLYTRWAPGPVINGVMGPYTYNWYLEDHPRTCKWLITMVRFRPLRIGLVPFQMAHSWLINGGDPNYWI